MEYQESLIRRIWLSLIRDLTDEPLYNFMKVYFGSVSDVCTLINAAQEVCSFILSGDFESQPENKFWAVYDWFMPVRSTGYTDQEAEQLSFVLQILRFPKRYTPSKTASTLPKFWEGNERMKQFEFNPNNIIIQTMRHFCCQWLEGYRLKSTFSLSKGNDLEGSKTFLDKLNVLESIDPTILGWQYGPLIENIKLPPSVPYNKLTSVPKSYKGGRNIAVESQWTTYISTPVAEAIESCLPEFVSVDDQDRNQELCLRGSIDNSLSTIDLSAASDSVSCKLCRCVLPWHVYKDLLRVTSVAPKSSVLTYQPKCHTGTLMVESKCRYNTTFGVWEPLPKTYGMVSTMGNRVTFPLEELIFSSAVATAFELAGFDYRRYIDDIAVYGDDIIVPSFITQTVMDILHAVGFTVNSEKSFTGNEFYRESCGVEFFHGIELTTEYWPRKTVSEGDLTLLVPLQHKLYKYPYANDLICRHIRKVYPKITESRPGSKYDDIWSSYPNIRYAYSSYDRSKNDVVGEQTPSCEIHSTFVPGKKGKVTLDAQRYCYWSWLRDPQQCEPDDPLLSLCRYREPMHSKELTVEKPSMVLKPRKYLI